MWKTATNMITNIGHAFTSAKVRHQFHSIIGITEIAHETVVAGRATRWSPRVLSLVLAVITCFRSCRSTVGSALVAWLRSSADAGFRSSRCYRYSSVGSCCCCFS